ncbi:hypothetical protein GCM10023324_68000 [Streptomyces youssoufiensis]
MTAALLRRLGAPSRSGHVPFGRSARVALSAADIARGSDIAERTTRPRTRQRNSRRRDTRLSGETVEGSRMALTRCGLKAELARVVPMGRVGALGTGTHRWATWGWCGVWGMRSRRASR